MRAWRNWQTHQIQVLAGNRGSSSLFARTIILKSMGFISQAFYIVGYIRLQIILRLWLVFFGRDTRLKKQFTGLFFLTPRLLPHQHFKVYGIYLVVFFILIIFQWQFGTFAHLHIILHIQYAFSQKIQGCFEIQLHFIQRTLLD